MTGATRPGLAIVASVVVFALAIEAAGLVPAVIATVVVASRGSRDLPLRAALLFAAALAAAVAVLFVGLLGQPFVLVRTW